MRFNAKTLIATSPQSKPQRTASPAVELGIFQALLRRPQSSRENKKSQDICEERKFFLRVLRCPFRKPFSYPHLGLW
jgi:hypothetical protein